MARYRYFCQVLLWPSWRTRSWWSLTRGVIHMFCLYYKGKRYELRFDPDGPKASRPNRVHLEKMKLAPGDELTMIYDYGCNWEFQITFKGTRPMEPCKGNHYPHVTAGAGRGIIKDMFPGELLERIENKTKQANRNFQACLTKNTYCPINILI